MDNVKETRKNPKYWGSRPDRESLQLFYNEIVNGNLRQGWGYDKSQDLRLIFEEEKKGGDWWQRITQDQKNAYRNYPFYPGWGDDTIRKDDIVLVPCLPTYGYFVLLKVLDDEYRLDIIDGDYGHCRNVKLLTIGGIANDNEHVSSSVRSTLKCRSRIWRIDQSIGENLNYLLQIIPASPSVDFKSHFNAEQRYNKIVAKAKDEAMIVAREKAKKEINDCLDKEFNGSEFETPMKKVLESAYPGSTVYPHGGPAEKEHGTDLLIRIPNPVGDDFLIPVQVKMHTGESDDGIDQLEKAFYYWKHKGVVIALILANTADLTPTAMQRLEGLKAKTTIPCYHLNRDKILELFVDASFD